MGSLRSIQLEYYSTLNNFGIVGLDHEGLEPDELQAKVHSQWAMLIKKKQNKGKERERTLIRIKC